MNNYTVRLQDKSGREFRIQIMTNSENQARRVARETYKNATVFNAWRTR